MRKIKIGIADDNREFCDILTEYFSEKDNIDVDFVSHDGVKTVECVKKHMPEILILDMIMPHLDGLGVLEEISGISENNSAFGCRTGTDNAESYKSGRRILHSQAFQS